MLVRARKTIEPRGVPCGRGLGWFLATVATMSSVQPGPSPPAIQAALSTTRFKPYLDAAGQSPQLALHLYEWNIGLSAAFWEVIVVVEVVTRNAMHDQLATAYGANWYDNNAILDDRSLRVIREAKRRASRGLPKSTPLSPGKVVSEMGSGAWVALLDQGGDSTTEGRASGTTTRSGSLRCSMRSRAARATRRRPIVGSARSRASGTVSGTMRRSSTSRSRTRRSACMRCMRCMRTASKSQHGCRPTPRHGSQHPVGW